MKPYKWQLTPRIGYMDMTDYDCELGHVKSNIYSSIEECIKDNKCIEECGIVKVEIKAIEIVQNET